MKKINSGLLAAFVLTMIGALLIGGATVALFTDTAENTGNSFAAGTIAIDLNREDGMQYFDIENIAPGDSGSAVITVSNSGSLELRYKFDDLEKVGYLVAGGDHPIVFTLSDADGTLSTGEDGTFRVLEPGQSRDVTVDWAFSIDAGNDYQNESGSVGFSVYAEQTANN